MNTEPLPWPHANPEALEYVRMHELTPEPWETLRAQISSVPEPPAFALDAVRRIQGFWPQYAAPCRRALAEAVNAPHDVPTELDALHVYAGSLLAEHRDPHSFEIAQRIVALDEDACIAILGDDWVETVEKWLSAFCHHDQARRDWLVACVYDEALEEWMRVAALGAVIRCVGDDFFPRAQAVQLCLSALDAVTTRGGAPGGRLQREGDLDDSEMAGFMVSALLDLRPSRDVTAALIPYFDSDLIDETIVSREDVLEALDYGRTPPRLPTCTVKEISWWAWFTESQSSPDEDEDEQDEWALDDDLDRGRSNDLWGRFPEPSSTPFIRETLKVGRNEPCPCGSGKKFKKCCGA